MTKYVYLFKEADGDRKDLFGGKGANLAKMTSWGMPVPQGDCVTWCTAQVTKLLLWTTSGLTLLRLALKKRF